MTATRAFQDDLIERMIQSRAAKIRPMTTIPKGQRKTIAYQDPADRMAYFDTGTSTASAFSTTTTNQLTIWNDSGTTATIDTIDTSAGNQFLITTGSSTGGAPNLYTYTPPPGPPPPQFDPRILNRFLSASDLLEQFIEDLGTLGVKQGEVLSIPVELFINWLIVKAAEEDGHAPPDDIKALPDNVVQIRHDRCRDCGRFVTQSRRDAQVFFCNGAHADHYVEKAAA
jgi:hypothetical protein